MKANTRNHVKALAAGTAAAMVLNGTGYWTGMGTTGANPSSTWSTEVGIEAQRDFGMNFERNSNGTRTTYEIVVPRDPTGPWSAVVKTT